MNIVKGTIGVLLTLILSLSVIQSLPMQYVAGTILGKIDNATSGINIPNATTTGTSPNNMTANLLQLKNQRIDADVIPPVNTTIQENTTRAGKLNYDGTTIPMIYTRLGNETNNTAAAGLFEGDIILGREQIGGKAAHDSFITTNKWQNGVIPVVLHPDVPNRDNIIDAMIYMMNNSPVIFRPVEVQDGRIVDENFVVFVPSEERCASGLGMQGGVQYIFVPNWCTTGSLAHELGHTLGLWHEQTRCDRDDYIDVIEENIKPDWLSQFNTVCDPTAPEKSPVAFGDYDYCSIMHYPRFGTLSPIDPSKPIIEPLYELTGCDDIGLAQGVSEGDIAVLDELY